MVEISRVGDFSLLWGESVRWDDRRERLLRGIADLIDSEFGGRIVKGYLTTLYVAHRK